MFSDRIVSCNRLAMLLILAAASLAACGRRGPLEPPPGSAPPPRSQAAVDPTSQSNATRPSLARDTSGAESLNREQALTPAAPITVPKTPFFLDPLL